LKSGDYMIVAIKKILYLLPSGDKIKLVILFFMMLFGALLEVIGVGMIPVFVSILAKPEMILEMEWLAPFMERAGIETGGDLLVFGAIILIGVFFVKNAYIILCRFVQARFIWRRFAMIGSNLFRHYMSAPYEFHLKRNTAELLRNVTQEAQEMAKYVMIPLLILAMDIVIVIGIFAMLLWVEPLITLMVILLLGGGGGMFLKFIKNTTRAYGKTGQNDRAYMIRSVNEGLGGFKDARVLNREGFFFKKFLYHIRSYGKSQTYREVASASTKPVVETIAVSGMLLIALLLYWQGRGMETVIPVLTLFGAATIRLMPAIKGSASAITNLRYYLYTVEPIFDDTVQLTTVSKANRKTAVFLHEKNNTDADTRLLLKVSIKFNNVSYSYPGSNVHAVRNLSFSIPKGDVIGFVGASGAGKTTIVDLVLGLLEPKEGSITADGININSDLQSWRRNIGYIPQFIFLADDTIRNNIAFGLADHEIIESKVNNAIKASQLTDMINSLPNGVDTVIGERGTRLSGGQRQRIGIARALYHNPQVLIMDEATSALDNVTEKLVIEAIEKLRGERTIIMIAHRLSTVRHCDRLYMMRDGRIAESGTHDELINLNSEFQKMHFID
jgi:ATP-binding cassette, subfamily B, bacterial PglK